MSRSSRHISVLWFVWLLACSSGCTEPPKDPFPAPNLADASANSLITFVGDFDGQSQFDGSFEVGRFLGYRYAAPDGAHIEVVLRRTTGAVDPLLILYGPQRASGLWGEAIAIDDDGLGDPNPRLLAGPLQAGTYLVVVTTREVEARGTYRVTLRCLSGCEDQPQCPLTPVCADVDVCHSGFMLDARGCQTCQCMDECRIDAHCGPEEACLRGTCTEYCACNDTLSPVCGTNGMTFPNRCLAACVGVEVLSEGACSDDCRPIPCDLDCPHGYRRDVDGCEICACQDPCDGCERVQEPVCTRNGRTFTNRCLAVCVGEEVAYAGECRPECPELACGACPGGYAIDDSGCPTCQCVPEECADDGEQVCGANGITYANACEAEAAGVRVLFESPCPPRCHGDGDCPDRYACESGLRGFPDCEPTDPDCVAVCVLEEITCNTADGVSSANNCALGDVCRAGSCQSPCDCHPIFYPVCSATGATYANACRAHCADATVVASGPCCEPIEVDRCAADCANGLAVDDNGCEICACAEPSPGTVCSCDDSVDNPVCGADGVWYTNECRMRCAGVGRAADATVCGDRGDKLTDDAGGDTEEEDPPATDGARDG